MGKDQQQAHERMLASLPVRDHIRMWPERKVVDHGGKKATAKPVIAGGKQYRSAVSAANALGVHVQTMFRRGMGRYL